MLNTISWLQYVAAVILLSVAWYGYVGLRYYRPEIASFFKIKPQVRSMVPTVAAAPAEVIGSIREDAGEITLEPEHLIFGNITPDDISDQTIPKGPSDDLIGEAQSLINVYSDNNNKAEFLSLLRVLFEKYEADADEIDLQAVITVLQQSAVELPFPVNANEWPTTFN